jgi:hypothetical protein
MPKRAADQQDALNLRREPMARMVALLANERLTDPYCANRS